MRHNAILPLLPLLPILLSLLLVAAGCSTTLPVISRDMRRELQPGSAAIQFPTLDGDTYRLDPNSQIRFMLGTGEATPWIRGRDLWRSELGISYEERGEDHLHRLGGDRRRRVENLSGGKTVGVIALVGDGRPGGGPDRVQGQGLGGAWAMEAASGTAEAAGRARGRSGPSAGSPCTAGACCGTTAACTCTCRSSSPSVTATTRRPRRRRRRHRRCRRPLVLPPPEPGGEGVVEIHGASPAAPAAGQGAAVAPAAGAAPASPARAPSPAVPLFDAAARRRLLIQLIASVDAGTELVRLQGYTGSVVAGIRLRDVLELGGGLRHTIDPLREGREGERDFSLVGFGRLGFHFWLDDHHRFAIPLLVDAGAGHNVRFHLRVNYGLRFAPIRKLWIGLMPFNTSYTAFDLDPFTVPGAGPSPRPWSWASPTEGSPRTTVPRPAGGRDRARSGAGASAVDRSRRRAPVVATTRKERPWTRPSSGRR